MHLSPSSEPSDEQFPPDRLRRVVLALREMSAEPDPLRVTQAFRRNTQGLFPFDRTISLSRRGLERPFYRITYTDSGPDGVDVWRSPGSAPVLQGGLLGELIWTGEPQLIFDLQISPDDPAREYVAGMTCVAAVPHFDNGDALNMVVSLWNDPVAFDPDRFPELALISGLFGRAFKGLVVARTLRETQESLATQNKIMADLSDVVIEQATQLKRHADELELRVAERTADLDAAHADAVFMLAVASEQKDSATGDHIRRVESLTTGLARRLGFDRAAATAMGRAAILHDVGKLHVPDAVLQKPGPLTDAERVIVQEHTVAGERILIDRAAFAVARKIARSHHEDWAGTGYPDGLAGEAIPIEARIVHVVDVYDALVNARPYKSAWAPAAALDHMARQAGTMFDPRVIGAFVDMHAADA